MSQNMNHAEDNTKCKDICRAKCGIKLLGIANIKKLQNVQKFRTLTKKSCRRCMKLSQSMNSISPLITPLILFLFIPKLSHAEPIHEDIRPNPYISSCRHVIESQDEYIKPISLIVEQNFTGPGIPKWINGEYYMNAPSKYGYGERDYNHVFDASSMIRKFNIRHEKDEDKTLKVDFTQRYLASKSHTNNTDADDIVVTELFTLGREDLKFQGILGGVEFFF